MLTLYWFCLGGGFVFTLLLVFLGDLLDGALESLDGALDGFDLDGALDPLSFVAGVTVFGGAGILLSRLGLSLPVELAAAIAIGLALSILLHVVYVKPMKQSENSTGFSMTEYAGKTGEMTTGVSATGFGEVVVRMGAATTFQTAASFTGEPIADGTPVVVVEVDAEGVLRVAPLDAHEVSTPVEGVRTAGRVRA